MHGVDHILILIKINQLQRKVRVGEMSALLRDLKILRNYSQFQRVWDCYDVFFNLLPFRD